MSILDTLQDSNLLEGKENSEEKTEGSEGNQPTDAEKAAEEARIAEETQQAEAAKAQEMEATEKAKAAEEAAESGEDVEEADKSKEKQKSKIKVDYLDFYKQNKDVISAYEKEKSADYSSLSPEDAMKKSYKLKYPTLSDQEISEELKDKYGIGEDTEDYDAGEMLRFKSKQRNLKIDAADSIKELKAYQDSLELPEFELEHEFETEEQTAPTNIEEVIKQSEEKRQKEDAEFREKTWIPEVNKAVSGVSELETSVEIEGLGKVDVKVALDDNDKKAMSDYISGWVYHPSDAEFLDKEGNVNMEGFVKSRGAVAIQTKIVQAAAQSAVEAFKAQHMKNNVLNFNQETSQPRITTTDDEGVFDLTDRLRKN